MYDYKACSRQSLLYSIEGTDVKIPMTIIHGREKGKTVLITGGIHNAEYVGIEAATQIMNELDPCNMTGTVIIMPLINRTGYEHRTMSLVYEDEKNLNREFPGQVDGTLAQRICYSMSEGIFPNIDYYIDLHSGDGYEELTPYIYCVGNTDSHTAQEAEKMALMADVKYYTVSSASTGAYNYAGIMGIPSVLLERGCMGEWSYEEVEADKRDVYNILRYLSVLDGEYKEYKKLQVSNINYEEAPVTGHWYPEKKAGDRVKAGELLGIIKDYFGKEIYRCNAKSDGVILYQVRSLSIIEGGSMITYGSIVE